MQRGAEEGAQPLQLCMSGHWRDHHAIGDAKPV